MEEKSFMEKATDYIRGNWKVLIRRGLGVLGIVVGARLVIAGHDIYQEGVELDSATEDAPAEE